MKVHESRKNTVGIIYQWICEGFQKREKDVSGGDFLPVIGKIEENSRPIRGHVKLLSPVAPVRPHQRWVNCAQVFLQTDLRNKPKPTNHKITSHFFFFIFTPPC